MRSSELTNGVRIMDESGDHLGDSVTAAKWAIAQVRVSTQVLKLFVSGSFSNSEPQFLTLIDTNVNSFRSNVAMIRF